MNSSVKTLIQKDFLDCRSNTLSLFEKLDYQVFSTQIHPEFSPVGWHLGHIAQVWDDWIVVKYADLAPTKPEYRQLFTVDGLTKSERVGLPQISEVLDYVNLVSDRLLGYLESSSLSQEEEKLWQWLIQHESQHAETIAIVLQLQGQLPSPIILTDGLTESLKQSLSQIGEPELITIPSGYFTQGSDRPNAMDNESPAHAVYVDSFRIVAHPVTQGQYQNFISAGAYCDQKWWSQAGWQWLQKEQVSKALHWQIFGDHPDRPVCGLNWYEAKAYANFAGMRLPTEAEWEKAANYLGDRLLGKSQVWEWTSSLFHPYPNFLPYPYSGYSSPYFDQQHYVLKGGSWASSSYTLRSSFRNWYQPHVRQIFAGLRCVEL
ncbi:TIGR03440 family protein [Synechococcus sp. PCC 7502]|uniref:SUMF1/EgtB/PvdO family nonheme iron enzyme n=1 Tax=Synechococcus sp. PCC 7502 TaxID=1173263 RepID=UPI00029FE682|nr:SUMF1/EgtB/PvdO family nonheme iron enzyme [Synechococcus sp. PCC 7502]AFY72836.1 TIGR03440 family protein [Synechococcus sp. PCC 7502]